MKSISQKLQDDIRKIMEGPVDEALIGGQVNIDKNKNGKIDAEDFKILKGKKADVKKEEGVEEAVRGLTYGDQGWQAPANQAQRDAIAKSVKQKRASNRADTTTTGYGNRVEPQRGPESGTGAAGATVQRTKPSYGGQETPVNFKPSGDYVNPKHIDRGGNLQIKPGQGKGVTPYRSKTEEVESHVHEGWDDMVKYVKDKEKPQPNGGAGVKQGSRYGGSKQKDEKPVKEENQIDEKDEGKPGLMFKKIAAKAAAKYGSVEAGNRVAGAIRKKVLAKEGVEVTEEDIDAMFENLKDSYTFTEYLDEARAQFGDDDAVSIANDAYNKQDISLFIK